MTKNNSSRFNKCAIALAVASCMSLAMTAAEAAGLGKLTVYSSLGQPLKAEVELSATDGELPGMAARLAPQDVFKQAGVNYSTALTDLRFKVERRANGKSIIRLSSSRPINEPFLDFLVELTWPSGRLVREYTFLLDPPEFANGPGARSSVDAKIVETVRGGGATPEPLVPPEKPAPTRKPETVPEAKAPVGEPAATRLVERGDTLLRIANERRYAGVSLEQMLVGLYRNNREAFIGNDINRLRAGVILSIPDEPTVAAVPEKEARLVYVSAGDFAAYRRRLAEASTAGSKPEVPAAQAAGGRITPKVEEKTPAVDTSRDQVKVSRADAPVSAEIDRLAADKALQESQARVALLERNLSELQKLLEMKNQRLAELEKSGQPVATEAKPPLTPTEPPSQEGARVIDTATPPPAPVEPAPAPAPAAPAPAPVEPPTPAPPPPTVTPVPVEEALPTEDPLLENALPLAGGAAAIALLAGLLLYRRRRQAASPETNTTEAPSPSSLGPNSVFRMTGGQSVDTGSELPHTGDFSQAGPGTIDTDEVDPVSEADVYMAYGRDAQAEEILLEAMQKDPSRQAIPAKLLEIYANRRSVKQFETLAGELYAQTAGVGPVWEKVAALGAEIDPANPLYGTADDVGKAPVSEPTSAAAAVGVGAFAAVAATAATKAEESLPALDEGLAYQPPEPVLEPEPQGESEPEAALTFELPAEPAQPPAPEPEVEDDGMSLDFELGDPVQPAAAAPQAVPTPDADEAPAEENYVDTVVTSGEAADALDFDLSSLVAGDSAPAAGAGTVDTAAADFDLPPMSENKPAASMAKPAEAEDALDFSPEGTLVVSGTGNFGQTVGAEEFDLDPLPSSAMKAVKPMPATPERVDVPLSIDDPELVNTVVNPAKLAADDVDFDVKLSDSVFLGQPAMPTDFDIGSINLDLSAPPAEAAAVPPEPAEPAVAAPEVHDAQWEEVNTKLDLAKAYEEMGDLEGARELLQEVLVEGSGDLVAQAQTILARIDG